MWFLSCVAFTGSSRHNCISVVSCKTEETFFTLAVPIPVHRTCETDLREPLWQWEKRTRQIPGSNRAVCFYKRLWRLCFSTAWPCSWEACIELASGYWGWSLFEATGVAAIQWWAQQFLHKTSRSVTRSLSEAEVFGVHSCRLQMVECTTSFWRSGQGFSPWLEGTWELAREVAHTGGDQDSFQSVLPGGRLAKLSWRTLEDHFGRSENRWKFLGSLLCPGIGAKMRAIAIRAAKRHGCQSTGWIVSSPPCCAWRDGKCIDPESFGSADFRANTAILEADVPVLNPGKDGTQRCAAAIADWRRERLQDCRLAPFRAVDCTCTGRGYQHWPNQIGGRLDSLVTVHPVFCSPIRFEDCADLPAEARVADRRQGFETIWKATWWT